MSGDSIIKETTTIEMTFEQVDALCYLLCFVKEEQKQRYFDTIYGTYNYHGVLEGGLYDLLDKHRKSIST